jgi:hypothetical protein
MLLDYELNFLHGNLGRDRGNGTLQLQLIQFRDLMGDILPQLEQDGLNGGAMFLAGLRQGEQIQDEFSVKWRGQSDGFVKFNGMNAEAVMDHSIM